MIDGSTPEPDLSASGSSAATPTPAPRTSPDSAESPDFGADFIPIQSEPLSDIPVPPQIILSDEQQAILEEVLNGRSLFFTGSAGMPNPTLLSLRLMWVSSGTGKSVLLRGK